MFKESIEEIVKSNNQTKLLNNKVIEFQREKINGNISLDALQKEQEQKEYDMMITKLISDVKEICGMKLLINQRMVLIKDRMRAYKYKNKELLDLLNRIIKNKKVLVTFEKDILKLIK